MRLTRSFNKSLTYLAVTTTAIFVTTIGLTVQRSWFQTAAKATRTVKGEHKLYFPYYTVHGQWDSLLTLNNASRTPLEVALKAYSLEGMPLALPDQTLQPLTHTRLRLADLIGEANMAKFKEGSLELSFDNESPMALGPQLTVTDEHRNFSFDLEPPMGQKSAKLEGVWWSIGDKTEVNVIVSNTKERPLNVQINLDMNTDSKPFTHITLLAHQTAVFNVENLLKEAGHTRQEMATGGISISHNGDPDALVAHGFIVDREKGICSSLHLTDPATMKSSNLDGTGFPIGRYALTEQDDKGTLFKPILVLKNITESMQRATVAVQYTIGDEMKIEALPVATIAPREVRKMDFRPIIRSLGRRVVKDAGIRVDMNGQQGALIGELVSVSDEGICVNVPLLSVSPKISRSGAHPFRVDEDFQAVLHLKNIGDKPTEAIVHILHEAGDYALDLVKIQPGESVALDIRKLANSGKLDIHGNILPVYIVKGEVTWIQHRDQTLIGRLIQFSESQKNAANFSCSGLCNCNPEFDHGEFSPSSMNGSPIDEGDGSGQTGPLTVSEYDHYLGNCSGLPLEGPFPTRATFFSDNPSVATVDDFGNQLTLVGPGDTLIWATWETVTSHQCSGDGDCTTCEPVQGFVSASMPVSSTSVRVNLDEGGPIDVTDPPNPARNVIVGQRIKLDLNIRPARTVTNIQWTVPGTTVANWQGNTSTGIVTPLTSLNSSGVLFYWVSGTFGGESRVVQVTYRVNNKTFTRRSSYNVKRPTASVATTTGDIAVDSAFGQLETHYGRPGQPGISFTHSVSIPSGFSGDVAWFQVINNTLRRRQLNAGTWERQEGHGVLDATFPYSSLNPTSDSPGTGLSSSYLQYTTSQDFDMYLMFKPSIANSIWVPLRQVSWFWIGDATRNVSTNLWSLSAGSHNTNPASVDTITHPTWNGNGDMINQLPYTPE